jgi:hypothetical protein
MIGRPERDIIKKIREIRRINMNATKQVENTHEELCRLRVDQTAEQIKSIMSANKHLTEAKAAVYLASGMVAFAEAFLLTRVATNPYFTFSSGEKVRFEGYSWGPGFGGGVTWMAATFTVPPSELIGDVGFNFNSVGGQTNLNFWRGSTYLGSAVGAGLGVSIGVTGGSGKFSFA